MPSPSNDINSSILSKKPLNGLATNFAVFLIAPPIFLTLSSAPSLNLNLLLDLSSFKFSFFSLSSAFLIPKAIAICCWISTRILFVSTNVSVTED